MEPVLLEMIQQKMADGVIDEIEYMVLKDIAFTSSISEDRLKQLIETAKQAQGIEGNVVVQSKDEKIIPSLNLWWLYHFGWLDQSKVERSEDPLNKTNAHVALWKQVTLYLEYLVGQHLNNDLVQWKIKVNQYQIGALSYTY
ncbi:TPA: hypothetical protein EYN98_15440 [Candidatus Poribacteria bacterium]|nr:hypothetical protein [Candidatus Poribacteria bacterium]